MKLIIKIDESLVYGEAKISRSTFENIQKSWPPHLQVPDGVNFACMSDDPFRPKFVIKLSNSPNLDADTLYVSREVKNREYKDKSEIIIEGI
jgi:hypothetical protein